MQALQIILVSLAVVGAGSYAGFNLVKRTRALAAKKEEAATCVDCTCGKKSAR